MSKDDADAGREHYPARSWKEVRLGDRLLFAGFIVLVVPMVLLVAAGFWFRGYDEQWVDCQVISATGGRGGRTVPWEVAIETTDCKTVGFTEGVNEGNVHEIAASIEPGKVYEFQFDWLSRASIKYPIIFLDPTASEIREIP